MNRPAEQMAQSNGFVNFAKACKRYATSKAKLRQLVADGLLSCHTSDLDRRAKLLSLEELDRLFAPQAGK
jgi:hypothetical protein